MPQSPTAAILPRPLLAALSKLGRDISVARRRRRLTAAMMAERLGTSRPTYQKVERGDPSVAMGVYAMALYTLGLGAPLADLADPAGDDQGLLLEIEQLPQRVRPRKEPRAL